MGVSVKEKYLLGLLTEIKREIICQDVLRENHMQAGDRTIMRTGGRSGRAITGGFEAEKGFRSDESDPGIGRTGNQQPV